MFFAMKKTTRKERKTKNKKNAKTHKAAEQRGNSRPRRSEKQPQQGAQRHDAPSLYGFHAVREAWLNPERQVKALYMTQNAVDDFVRVIEEAKSKGLNRPAPVSIEKKKLDALLPPGAVHQGLGLVATPPEKFDLQDMLNHAAGRADTLLVILDQVTDPHNVGAIIRSACALGAHGLIMQEKHAPSLDGVLAKTACGGIEHLPVIYETNLSRTIEALQADGFFVYGLDERGDDIATIKTGGKSVLVLGAEGPGLRRLIKENCDSLIKLPMQGALESINVSNAAAVALYVFGKK